MLILHFVSTGHGMIGSNYDSVLKEKGMAPILVAIGEQNVGKSLAAKCMLSVSI